MRGLRAISGGCGVLAFALGGCASLSGLDEGTADAGRKLIDAGRDVAVVVDTGTADATLDAGIDATDATLDAPRDGGMRPDASDAGHDAARDAANDAVTDAPTGDTCVPVTLTDAGPAPACTASDGGCLPNVLTDFSQPWVPPVPPRAACTQHQINNLVNMCFGEGFSSPDCMTLLASATDQTCNECLITGSTATKWGPFVYFGAYGYYVPNIGGCLALVDPCEAPCAKAYEARESCVVEACGGACSGDFNACATVAFGCECAPENAAYADCLDALSVGPPETCAFAASNLSGFAPLATMFCGGLPGDAG